MPHRLLSRLVTRPVARLRARADPAPATDTVPVVVPLVAEVGELLASAGRVLTVCAEVEDRRIERAHALATALDPTLGPPLALLGGPGLPHPLADRVALRALRRVAIALHPTDAAAGPVAFREALVHRSDLAVLAATAARLDAGPRRGGALAEVFTDLRNEAPAGPGTARPADAAHPAALGCLLAVVVPALSAPGAGPAEQIPARLRERVLGALARRSAPGDLSGASRSGPARGAARGG